jgi:hypothetical protein
VRKAQANRSLNDVTTIQLCNGAATRKLTCVLGNNYQTPALIDGLEISDLTVNANYGATNAAVGGVAVSGKNILLRRVRAINFGSNGTGPVCLVLSVARAYSNIPFNCLISECRVDSPGGSPGTSACIALHLSAEKASTPPTDYSYHEGCGIRNCIVDFGTTNFALNYVGFAAGGGRGTIIEGNQIKNCQFGRSYDNQFVTIDQIIRNNYFFNVATGIIQDSTVAGTVGRLIVQKNVIEWPDPTVLTTAAIGVDLIGHATSGVFVTVIIRDNIFRRYGNLTPLAGDIGIRLNGCTNVTVENNVMNLATANNAFTHQSCTTVQVFNTRSTDGTFYPGYNSTAAVHDAELTTDVEIAVLGL